MSTNVEFLKQRCKESYATFCMLMQDDGWFDPIHARLCNWIQYHIMNESNKGNDAKLCIVMPRGSLKSTIVTKYLPTWLTINDSAIRNLIASNTQPNAFRKVNDIRGLYDSNELFRGLFPELLPDSSCKWTDTAATVKRRAAWGEATYESAGVKTKLTGRHYNVIIEDDTVAPDESNNRVELTVPSAAEIDRAVGWHKQATPLLVPKGFRARIIVTTRWADEDLVCYIREKEGGYKYFDMPAKDDSGKSLFTMFYGDDKLKEIEQQVGPYMFSCLYLNKPIDASLRVFNKEWFQYCLEKDVPEGENVKRFRTIAIDPAISEKDDACETSITEVLHVKVGDKSFQYWTRDIHGHFSPSETVKKTLDLAIENIEELDCIIIETVAYQAALKFAFRDELARRGLNINLVSFNSRTNKNVRIEGMQPYFAAKRIYFCEKLTNQVESQLKQFPHGKLVDVIDSFAMHLSRSKGDKWTKPKKSQAQEVDPNSGEAILDQIRKGKKKNKGCLANAHKIDYEHHLSTGLGLHVELPIIYGRN